MRLLVACRTSCAGQLLPLFVAHLAEGALKKGTPELSRWPGVQRVSTGREGLGVGGLGGRRPRGRALDNLCSLVRREQGSARPMPAGGRQQAGPSLRGSLADRLDPEENVSAMVRQSHRNRPDSTTSRLQVLGAPSGRVRPRLRPRETVRHRSGEGDSVCAGCCHRCCRQPCPRPSVTWSCRHCCRRRTMMERCRGRRLRLPAPWRPRRPSDVPQKMGLGSVRTHLDRIPDAHAARPPLGCRHAVVPHHDAWPCPRGRSRRGGVLPPGPPSVGRRDI